MAGEEEEVPPPRPPTPSGEVCPTGALRLPPGAAGPTSRQGRPRSLEDSRYRPRGRRPRSFFWESFPSEQGRLNRHARPAPPHPHPAVQVGTGGLPSPDSPGPARRELTGGPRRPPPAPAPAVRQGQGARRVGRVEVAAGGRGVGPGADGPARPHRPGDPAGGARPHRAGSRRSARPVGPPGVGTVAGGPAGVGDGGRARRRGPVAAPGSLHTRGGGATEDPQHQRPARRSPGPRVAGGRLGAPVGARRYLYCGVLRLPQEGPSTRAGAGEEACAASPAGPAPLREECLGHPRRRVLPNLTLPALIVALFILDARTDTDGPRRLRRTWNRDSVLPGSLGGWLYMRPLTSGAPLDRDVPRRGFVARRPQPPTNLVQSPARPPP